MNLKDQFPFFAKHSQAVYLDNACQSLRPAVVLEAMDRYYREVSSCAGRSNHTLAEEAEQAVINARQSAAKWLGAQPKEVVFLRNATEALNLVAAGWPWQAGDVVLTSGKEHNSNLLPWQRLAKQGKIKHRVVPLDNSGNFSLDNFKESLAGASFVSVPWVSNLDGEVLPLKEIVELSHQAGALVMVDAAQAAAHFSLDVKKLGVDFLALSGHKVYGPTGTGVLWGKYELLEKLEPLLVGGGTVESSTYETSKFLPVPARLEAGLQDYAGIIGLGAAVDWLKQQDLEKVAAEEHCLAESLRGSLAEFPDLVAVGPSDPVKRSGIVSFWSKKQSVHELSLLLSKAYQVYMRSGQLCVNSWFATKGLTGVVRASFGIYNNETDVQTTVSALREITKL